MELNGLFHHYNYGYCKKRMDVHREELIKKVFHQRGKVPNGQNLSFIITEMRSP